MDPAITKLNNIAVSIAARGDLQRALHMYCDALAGALGYLRQMEARSINAHPIDNVNSGNAPLRPSANVGGKQYAQRATSCEHTSLELHTTSESNGFLHTGGVKIVISGSRVQNCANSLTDAAVVCATILFNIGALSHCKGLTEEQDRVRRLQKARTVYMKGINCLTCTGASNGSTRNIFLDFLWMTLLNNLAHVSYELFEYHESRSDFDRLLRFLQTIDVDSYPQTNYATLIRNHRIEYFCNAMVLNKPPVAAAEA